MFGKFSLYAKDFDWLIFLLAMGIAVVGVIEIHSATQYDRNESFYLKQIYRILLGVLLMVVVMSIDYHALAENGPYLYAIAILALISVLLFGKRVSGSKSWISLGGFFELQPSELVKVVVVIALARFLCEIRTEHLTGADVVKASAIAGVPILLVMLQPDLGSAMTFIPILLVGLSLGGLPPKWIVGAAIMAVLAVGAGWYNLKAYQKERIYTFLQPERDPQGHGYHSIQSKIAVGSGGFWGKGVGKGSQTRLGFLPERHTDFIFSVVGEELGFVGAAAVLLFYLMIIGRSVQIAQTARDKLGIYLTMGAVSVLLFHILENVGMVVGLMPITGIPLPLLSYGGSSVMATFMLLGLIVNVRMRRYVN
ncbi:MAG: rod shape-determining protein RodA [Acidimicrobiia bacterium]|nr:rod shape-determining protein RodA [Acidimicrobiia bacterium]